MKVKVKIVKKSDFENRLFVEVQDINSPHVFLATNMLEWLYKYQDSVLEAEKTYHTPKVTWQGYQKPNEIGYTILGKAGDDLKWARRSLSRFDIDSTITKGAVEEVAEEAEQDIAHRLTLIENRLIVIEGLLKGVRGWRELGLRWLLGIKR